MMYLFTNITREILIFKVMHWIYSKNRITLRAPKKKKSPKLTCFFMVKTVKNAFETINFTSTPIVFLFAFYENFEARSDWDNV